MTKTKRGFTIVELLVVIAVIGILLTITVAGFTRYQADSRDSQRSARTTIVAAALEKYYDHNGEYPSCPAVSSTATNVTTITLPGTDPSVLLTPTATPGDNSIKCTDLVGAAGEADIFAFVGDGSTPCISGAACMSWTLKYKSEASGTIKQIQSYHHSAFTVCPSGFISVPGSSTYNTANFCVMKYEAKQSSATVPISQAAGLPWVSISQYDIMSYSSNVVGCVSCHLISESEWLTLAQNVISVPSNWSGGAVGSGYIYSGHNDNVPSNSLAASTDDSDGYFGTDGSGTSNQRRTLTLTNGEVIWDLAGNVWEWTSGQTTGGQPGKSGDSTYQWNEWNTTNLSGSLSPNPFPSFNTTGAGSWTSAKGIGMLYSYGNDWADLSGFIRGSDWSGFNEAGVLTLGLNNPPWVSTGTRFGFRVAR